MWYLVLIAVFGSLLSGTLPGLLTLCFVVLWIAELFALPLVGFQLVLLMAFVLAVPLVGKLAGYLLDSCALPLPHAQTFGAICTLFACAVMLSSESTLSFLEGYLAFTATASVDTALALFIQLISTAVFCATTVVLVTCCFLIVFELPGHWIGGVKLGGVAYQSIPRVTSALRPLLVVLLLSISAKLVVGMVDHEFHPQTVVSHMQEKPYGEN